MSLQSTVLFSMIGQCQTLYGYTPVTKGMAALCCQFIYTFPVGITEEQYNAGLQANVV